MLTMTEFMFMPWSVTSRRGRKGPAPKLNDRQRAELVSKRLPAVDRSGWYEEQARLYGVTARYIRKILQRAREGRE
jgi:hypothetical protein